MLNIILVQNSQTMQYKRDSKETPRQRTCSKHTVPEQIESATYPREVREGLPLPSTLDADNASAQTLIISQDNTSSKSQYEFQETRQKLVQKISEPHQTKDS